MVTLVLNAGYEPLRQVSWQHAISLWFAGRVELVEPYRDGRVARSSRSTFPVPAVVRFARATRHHRRRLRFSKRNVYLRDGGKCQYCRRQLPIEQATYDHVIPRSRGGPTTWENILIACLPCNQRKGNRTPIQAGMRPLHAPSRPRTLPTTLWQSPAWQQGMPPSWRAYLRH